MNIQRRSRNWNWQVLEHTEIKRIVFSYMITSLIKQCYVVYRQLKGLYFDKGCEYCHVWSTYWDIKMASISSTTVNGKLNYGISFSRDNHLLFFFHLEFLPGLEDFLRSMVNSSNLDTDHREIATLYLDRLDQLSQLSTQQTSIIEDSSL